MAITSATDASQALSNVTDTASGNPKGILGKDDFLKLLLTELQYQDPTAPTDTEKILSQTSQLATLESTDKTNQALENLAATLGGTQQFSTIAAIGKMADLGSSSIIHEKNSNSSFELYFPEDVTSGTIDIEDEAGNTVATIALEAQGSGVQQFAWDGLDASGNAAEDGIYSITANYTNPEGSKLQTQLGKYPIESVRFDNGNTLVKVGSNYVPLENIREVY